MRRLPLLLILLLLVVSMQLVLDAQRGLDVRHGPAILVAKQRDSQESGSFSGGGASQSHTICGGADGPEKRTSNR